MTNAPPSGVTAHASPAYRASRRCSSTLIASSNDETTRVSGSACSLVSWHAQEEICVAHCRAYDNVDAAIEGSEARRNAFPCIPAHYYRVLTRYATRDASSAHCECILVWRGTHRRCGGAEVCHVARKTPWQRATGSDAVAQRRGDDSREANRPLTRRVHTWRLRLLLLCTKL